MNYVSNNLTVKELKATAKQYGITQYSKLNKADLVDYINDHVKAAAQDIVEAIEAADEIEELLIAVEVPTEPIVAAVVEEEKYPEPELALAVLLVIIDQALDFTYDCVVVPLAKVAYQILLASYTLWCKARPRRLVNNL
jgi:Rho termination factor, N-terminal domain